VGGAGLPDGTFEKRQHDQDGAKKSSGTQYALYFNCQTTLVDSFRTLFPTEFSYEGNRSIVFDTNTKVPAQALKFCIAMALTYHRNRAEASA